MQSYKLCLDEQNRYVYDCIDNKKTPFFRYLRVDRVSYVDDDGTQKIIDNALKFSSKVIWYA